jgi:hypothetical protein
MEYIPGYTMLKNIPIPAKVTEFFTWSKPNIYELFAPSITDTLSSSNSVNNSNVRRWSSRLSYSKDDVVTYNGFIYTCRKDASNINPVKEIVDDFITVNDEYWIPNGLSPKVKEFNPDTDMKKVYPMETIVNINNVLYLCNHINGCTYGQSNVFIKLSSDFIEIPKVAEASYKENLTLSLSGMTTMVSDLINDFTIEEIPGEPFMDTVRRVWGIMYKYLFGIVVFILAVLFASFAANDLLHKHPAYRILAFVYTYHFVITQSTIGYMLFFYYLFRSFFGERFSMNPLKIYGILPLSEDPTYDERSKFPSLSTYPVSLRKYIEQGKTLMQIAKLQSHGDVTGMLMRSLRLDLNSPEANKARQTATAHEQRGPTGTVSTEPTGQHGTGFTSPKGPPSTQGPTGTSV